MNKIRRDQLKYAISLIAKASLIIETVSDDEQFSMDNIPENLQGSERYMQMEECVNSMGSAVDHLESAVDDLNDVM